MKFSRKVLSFVVLEVLLVFSMYSDSVGAINQSTNTNYFNASIVKEEMEFRVNYIKEEQAGIFNYSLDDISYIPLKQARIIVIDDVNGEIIKSGFTDNNGLWKTDIIVNKDSRFKNKELGTVTTITIADGFNETIHFNVPVNEFGTFTSGDIILLHAINPKGRNEPHYDGTRFHRFTVFEMLDDYAERMGLTRQPPFNIETPPWSPRIKGE